MKLAGVGGGETGVLGVRKHLVRRRIPSRIYVAEMEVSDSSFTENNSGEQCGYKNDVSGLFSLN